MNGKWSIYDEDGNLIAKGEFDKFMLDKPEPRPKDRPKPGKESTNE